MADIIYMEGVNGHVFRVLSDEMLYDEGMDRMFKVENLPEQLKEHEKYLPGEKPEIYFTKTVKKRSSDINVDEVLKAMGYSPDVRNHLSDDAIEALAYSLEHWSMNNDVYEKTVQVKITEETIEQLTA